jgi:hypothetical protein
MAGWAEADAFAAPGRAPIAPLRLLPAAAHRLLQLTRQGVAAALLARAGPAAATVASVPAGGAGAVHSHGAGVQGHATSSQQPQLPPVMLTWVLDALLSTAAVLERVPEGAAGVAVPEQMHVAATRQAALELADAGADLMAAMDDGGSGSEPCPRSGRVGGWTAGVLDDPAFAADLVATLQRSDMLRSHELTQRLAAAVRETGLA